MFKNPSKLLCCCVTVLILLCALHFTLCTYVSAAALTAKITLATGSVEVKIGGAPAWKKAEKNMLLGEKDEIRTGAGGRVVITLENGSKMTLDENSSLALNELEESSVQVAMNAGKMNAKVKKMGAGGKFEVGTPASVCAVRGTDFSVLTSALGDSIECYRGSVSVKKSGSLEEAILQRWQKLLVSEDQPLGTAINMSSEEKDTVLAPVKTELSEEVKMGMSREEVQAAAALEIKLAEYQQGKSIIDAFGNRVRMEEYIVRPVGTTDRFKMVVLNEREKRFDYFTWTAAFKDKNDRVADLPVDLTEATKWISWDRGSSKPDYYLSSNESAASNTADTVDWGWTDGHIVSASGDYEHLYDGYYFKINTVNKISYKPKSGLTNITSLANDVEWTVAGEGSGLSTSDFLTWWGDGVTGHVKETKPSGSDVYHDRLRADFTGGSWYYEDYYIIDDNGTKATEASAKGLFNSVTGKYRKDELLKWNQEMVFTADDFTGTDKKIDLVVEPKIFIDAGLIDAE